MKHLALLAAGGLAAGMLLTPALPAQGRSQEELKALYQEKLAKEFVKHGGWITDFDEAKEKAREEGRVIFVYFTRSYAP